MSEEKLPTESAENTQEKEATPDIQELARTHSPETPESALLPIEQAPTFEPPESITNVSEVIGIAEEEKEEINMLGAIAGDIRRAQNVLDRINNFDPEKIKPREVALIAERKTYLEEFITSTRALKDEGVNEGVALLRGLPNAKEIENSVDMNDEATIAELTLRKKSKDQPLSEEEDRALFRAFKSRDRFFDQLKALGIEKDSARELYLRMIAEKSVAVGSHTPSSVVSTPAVTEEGGKSLSEEFTPELLAAISALNSAEEKEALERNQLATITDVEEVLKTIPDEEWNFATPNIDESASPEMLEALKRDGIHVKEGKKLTALQALTLRRNVLGKRGTDDIARTQERIAARARKVREEMEAKSAAVPPGLPKEEAPVAPASVAPEVETLSHDGIVVEELPVEEIVITPIEEESAGRTMAMRRQKGRQLLSWEDASLDEDTPEEMAVENSETLSLEELHAQIAALEALPGRTPEDEKKLQGLIWLRDNAAANGFADQEETRGAVRDAVIKHIETLLPNAILSSESVNEITRVALSILPHDARTLAEPKEDVLASGTPEEKESYRAAEERWENFMNVLESVGIDPDVAEKVYNKIAIGTVRSIDERIITEYGERFNIGKEVLEGIEGFADLTPGQQLLVLENFKKTAAQDVSAEGLKMYKEDLAKSGFFGRAWKNMTKQYQIGKAKGVVAEAWREGEGKEILAMKRDTLEGLTKIALTQKEFDVLEKDGTLETQFASEKLFGGRELSSDEKAVLAHFNEAANHYANLDFTGMSGDKEELRALAEKEYQNALTSVTEMFTDRDAADGALWQHKVRSAVEMNRFFADNPELEKELDRSAGATAFLSGMNTLTERATIAGAGMGLRLGAVSMIGTAGLFVAAPIVGGYLGARRAKQSFAERDLLARMGEQDDSDGRSHERTDDSNEHDVAKNIVDAEMLRKKLTQSMKELDEVTEMQMLEVAKRDESGALQRDASGNVIKETITKKEQLLSSIDARIEYTKRKLEEELVNLGGTNAIRITAINDLMEVLGRAEAVVALEKPENKNILSERLDNLLDIRKEKIEDNRKYIVRKEAVKGATLSLGFAIAGSAIGAVVRNWMEHSGVVAPTPKTIAATTLVEGKAMNNAYQSLVGRPVSETEFEMLQRAGQDAGDDIGKGTLYGDMLEAVRSSKVPLSEIDLARVIQAHSTPEEIAMGGGPIPHPEIIPPLDLKSGVGIPSVAAHVLETTPKVYAVGAGDTLTSVLKQHVSEIRALSSDGQENAVQNFLRSLSADDLKAIGVGTDPNKLAVGQSLDLERVVALLHEKQVGGADILKHAEILTAPRGEMLDSGAMLDAAPSVADVAPHADIAHAAAETTATPSSGAPATLHNPTPEETPALGNSATDHIESSGRPNFHDLPPSARILEADTTAQQYLENDVTTLYGPKSKFGYWPREWTSISARNADAVLAQTKETDPHSLLASSDDIPPGYEWSNVSKMQQYLREQGFTKEHGIVPREKESIGEFIKRAYTEKIMKEGPMQPQGN